MGSEMCIRDSTGTVLLCSLVVGACIWLFDYVAVSAVRLLIGLAG